MQNGRPRQKAGLNLKEKQKMEDGYGAGAALADSQAEAIKRQEGAFELLA